MNITTLTSKFSNFIDPEAFIVDTMVKRMTSDNMRVVFLVTSDSTHTILGIDCTKYEIDCTKYEIDSVSGTLKITTLTDNVHQSTELSNTLISDFYDVVHTSTIRTITISIYVNELLEEVISFPVIFDHVTHDHRNIGIVSTLEFSWNPGY